MGFFSKLFSNPNNVQKFCSQRVIDYYFYYENGSWYSRRPLCFRPYFKIDENNNLIEIASRTDNSQSIPLYFDFYTKKTPYSDTIEKEVLMRNPNSDTFEFWRQRGYEGQFIVTRENLLNRLSEYIPYHISTDHHGKTNVIRQERLKSKKDADGNISFYTDDWSEELLELSEYNPEKILWHKKSPIPLFKPKGSFVNSQQKDFKHTSLYSSLLDDNGIPLKRYLWVIDFETTGLNPDWQEILETGLCVYEVTPLSFNLVREYSSLRKCKIPEEVSKLTGISQNDIDENGITDEEFCNDLKELYEMYGENAIFASYNLMFDAAFFISFCDKHSLKFDFDWLDILTIARDRFEYPHKLGNILERLSQDKNSVNYYSDSDLRLINNSINSHRALDDAKAAFALLLIMLHSFDDIAKYIGLVGELPNHRFKYFEAYKNLIAPCWKGRMRGKVIPRLQFYKQEYPVYFNNKTDIDLYNEQNKDYEEWDVIYPYFDEVDYKLSFKK